MDANKNFQHWPSIHSLSNLNKSLEKYPELLNGLPTLVHYNGKIKQHGTNSCVGVLTNGDILYQSHEHIITPENDNQGFARWASSPTQMDFWQRLNNKNKTNNGSNARDIFVFGEFGGPGINDKVALNKIPEKIFSIFTIQVGPKENCQYIVDPREINSRLPNEKHPSNLYIIPWLHDSELEIDWSDRETIVKAAEIANQKVLEVEACDPWVKENFGIEGTGEGIVYYPVSHPGRENFKNLAWKAKGKKHQMTEAKEPVQVDPEVLANKEAFAAAVLTPARLEQGVRFVSGGEEVYDLKNMGKFLGWVGKDVLKECSNELEVSGLNWKDVQKFVTEKARMFYYTNATKI